MAVGRHQWVAGSTGQNREGGSSEAGGEGGCVCQSRKGTVEEAECQEKEATILLCEFQKEEVGEELIKKILQEV